MSRFFDVRTGGDALISFYPQIHAAAWKVDNRTWPTDQPPPRAIPILAVYPSGATKWFSHDPGEQSIVLADIVGPDPDFLVNALERARELGPQPDGRPVTISVS